MLLTHTDLSPHVRQAISETTLIQSLLNEMKGRNYQEFHPICQDIFAAYSSCGDRIGVDQLKPFASFAPSSEFKELRFNFVFDCLTCLLKRVAPTLPILTECSSLVKMLLAQEVVCDHCIACVVEIANQCFGHDSNLLFSYLVENRLLSPIFLDDPEIGSHECEDHSSDHMISQECLNLSTVQRKEGTKRSKSKRTQKNK
jgi:hypothetical protein